MASRIEYEDLYVTVEVIPEQRIIRSTWRGNVSGEHYRSALMVILRIVERDHLKYWLTDARQMGPILFEDQQWSVQIYMPMLVRAGLDRIAVVNSSDVLNVLAVDRMVTATPQAATYTIAFFENPSIAQLWLTSKEDAPANVEKKP